MQGFANSRARRTLGLLSAAMILSAAQACLAAATALPGALYDEVFVAGEAVRIDVPLDTASFLKGGYPIDTAGFVDLPIVGRVQFGGQTREQAEAYLSEKFANYLKDAHVRAIPAIRLTLLGNWTHQGQYYVSPNATVWEAVLAAGGIAGERNLDQLEVHRGDRAVNIPVLEDYSKGKSLAASGIQSGDILIIPVPRDNTGGWYWFREGLNATATVATIISGFLTVYITYYLLDNRNN